MPEITVSVTSPDGRPVVGATVDITGGNGQGSITSTDSDGEAVVSIAPGRYNLEVLHRDFQQPISRSIQIDQSTRSISVQF